MSYTKGPWKLDVKLSMRDRCQVIRGEEEPFLSKCYMNFIDTEEEIANAQLIATAPELLEALEKLHSLLDFEEKVLDNTAFTFENAKGINDAFELAYKAINKAKGGNQ